MKSNNIYKYILSKIILSYVLFFFINININKINSYLLFPLEYLPEKNYKFFKTDNLSPEQVIQQIYYKNLITTLEIGSHQQKISLPIETNSEKFYISSSNPSISSNEKGKESQFYQFNSDELYNELLSSTYINDTCKKVSHYYNYYSEECHSRDIINFNYNNTSLKREFPFKFVKNNDGNITGCLGLLFNDSNFEYTKGFVTEIKAAKLIDNYYWFFNFDEFSPLEKKLKGQFVLGGIPHEIFPKKYNEIDFETTSSAEASFAGRAWRLNLNKIIINNEKDKIIQFDEQIMTFNYEIYNIIASMKFRFEIEDLIMDELVKQNKCFCSNFSQNIYSSYNLTFYYCLKSVKDILYEKIPSIKFSSIELNYIFELTKEELFYEKGDYIYFMILFTKYESNTYWIMGQIFTSKYNFVFNNDKKQVGFYKKVTKDIGGKENENHKISIEFIIVLVVIGAALIFTIVGLVLGKKIFGLRRKIIANELTDELNYEYKSKDDDKNFQKPSNLEINNQNNSNQNQNEDPFGINNKIIN